MKNKCSKCKKSLKGGATIVEGGKCFAFCNSCSTILENAPTGNTVHAFMQKDGENWVEKNIREAKERRERGEGYWN